MNQLSKVILMISYIIHIFHILSYKYLFR